MGVSTVKKGRPRSWNFEALGVTKFRKPKTSRGSEPSFAVLSDLTLAPKPDGPRPSMCLPPAQPGPARRGARSGRARENIVNPPGGQPYLSRAALAFELELDLEMENS
jgi:hypothetical protein